MDPSFHPNENHTSNRIISMNYIPPSNQMPTNGTLSQSLLYPHSQHHSQNPYHSMQYLSQHSTQFTPAPAATLTNDYTVHHQPSQGLAGYTPPSKLTKLSNSHLIVEACQSPLSAQRASDLADHIATFLRRSSSVPSLSPGASEKISEFEDAVLSENLKFIQISAAEESSLPTYPNSLSCLSSQDSLSPAPSIHVYQLYEGGATYEDIDDEEVGANRQVASHWMLPSSEMEDLWESLIFHPGLKTSLINYAKTLLLFSTRGVNSSLIACNRIVLLYGPPGTGKTSLCRGLAQKLSIMLNDRFTHCQLVEVNSHSLFSKWFSESGKLVQKMFDRIKELAADRNALVCILIDEVESLAAARSAFVSGSEPSDALRVVNAVLTQIDSLRLLPNVLILCTSNITGAIDLAFVDRADIKQYIGPPNKEAVYRILKSCLQELMRAGLVSPPQPLLDERALQLTGFVENDVTRLSLSFYRVSQSCEGMSGRSLRKLPFLAYSSLLSSGQGDQVSVGASEFIQALEINVQQQMKEKEELQLNSGKSDPLSSITSTRGKYKTNYETT